MCGPSIAAKASDARWYGRLSRGAAQRGCQEFGSDALADNTVSAAAHRALGFEEVEVIRAFRKPLTTSVSAGAAVESGPT